MTTRAAQTRHQGSLLRSPATASLLAVLLVLSAATAWAVVASRPLVAVGIALTPLAVWEFARLREALVLLGASLPFVNSIAGAGSPVNVAVSDLLLAFIFAGIIASALSGERVPFLRALNPLRVALAPYSLLIILLLAAHPGTHELLQTGQRFELFLIPAVVGAYAALTDRHRGMLMAYVIAASAFAVVWPLNNLGIQKNPAGQLLTNAILLIVAYRPLRKFTPCLLLLVPGLFLTQSRGAIAASLIGAAVLALMRPARGRLLLTRIAPLLLAAVVAFTLMSTAGQRRLTTFSSGTQTSAQYSIYIRDEYTHDALRLIKQHRVTGIGVGNYVAGSAAAGTDTTDPHDVILLEAAEGGYGLAAAFLLLILGTSAVLFRFRRLELAPAALAVVMATVAHGLVDVYWVRGTPILGWLLVGMVFGLATRTSNSGAV